MAEKTGISWADSVVNLWVGCEKVGPGCDRCYAQKWAARAGHPELWEGERRRTKTWGDMRKWQKRHGEFFEEHGRRRRVFVNSLSDFYDKAAPKEWRADAWEAFKAAPDMDLYLVTKRISNMRKMLPPDFGPAYRHIVQIVTVVNQEEATRDIPRLVAMKKAYPWLRIGLSIEPMIGFIFIPWEFLKEIDWVIVGGESGGDARPMDPKWAISLLSHCRTAGVPFHFKQTGSNHQHWPGQIAAAGTYPAEWPAELRVREWPREEDAHV